MIFDPFLTFAARKIRFVFQVEDYETLSPYMMDILSMRATPLPTTLAGSTRCTHEKKKKRCNRHYIDADRGYLALNTDFFRKTTETTLARKRVNHLDVFHRKCRI